MQNYHFTQFILIVYCSNIEQFMENNQDLFDVLRKIKSNPEATQRELASELNFSLGKLNYCLKALKTKGLIKLQNFRRNPKKMQNFYVLTTKGISEKTNLTIKFMKRKIKEYDELRKEIEVDENK